MRALIVTPFLYTAMKDSIHCAPGVRERKSPRSNIYPLHDFFFYDYGQIFPFSETMSSQLRNSLQSLFNISFITVRVEGWEEYLRLTGEGHPTDGETAKHTLPAHHIDLP